MAENVTTKQNSGLQEAVAFSVAVGESTDINDVARLAVIARYCGKDQVYEELSSLIPLSGTTTGQDLLTSFINYFDSKNINIRKIFCVTTDGTPAMVGKDRGFVKLLENHIGQEMESEYVDLPLYSHVRWLSRGNVLNKFVSCVEHIQVFLNEKKQHFPELNDKEWLCKLMFLTDITNHLNELNLRLQGQSQTVLELFEYWKNSNM
ncbi:hypothetical protein J437_LFUL017713 [Ladona fulva]|uniref:General transcription factor II-I repeat domain-containing protein 2A n=1 Tax=Ladona fulva TaxID=123851 RepID=A0A8K0PAL6_LADFU|nr:hypothetical protein J437_LFUL017713 [Ladona fulva]